MSAEILIQLPDPIPSLVYAIQDGIVLRGTNRAILDVNHAFRKTVVPERAAVIVASGLPI